MTAIGLRPLTAMDYEYAFLLLVAGGNGARWRFRGMTPSPEAFERALWSGVAAQLVAEAHGRPVGLAMVFNPLLEAGHAEIGMAIEPGLQKRSGYAVGIGLGLMRYAFLTWPLHKLYGRIPGFNMADLRSITRYGWVEEGRLRDYCYAGGRYWDEHILAISREEREKIDRRFARLVPEVGLTHLPGGGR